MALDVWFTVESMPSGTPSNLRIHGSVLEGLGRYLDSCGYDLQALALEFNLLIGPEEHWSKRYISLTDYALFLERVAEFVEDPLFGLNWTRAEGEGGMRPIALAARFAPTPIDALHLMARFANIGLDLTHCAVVIEDETVSYEWDFSPLVVQPHQLNDRFAGIVAARFREGFAGISAKPLRVELRRPTPEDSSEYRRVYGCPVEFRSPRQRLVYSRQQLEQMNPASDDELFQALVELCERKLADSRKPSSLVSMVEDFVVSRIASSDLNLEQVARDLGMSGRVLQRRLAEKGVSFQEIHDRLRRQLASELLVNTDVPVSEVAYRLGFSATGNFSRAAKRWFGESPKQWRRRQG